MCYSCRMFKPFQLVLLLLALTLALSACASSPSAPTVVAATLPIPSTPARAILPTATATETPPATETETGTPTETPGATLTPFDVPMVTETSAPTASPTPSATPTLLGGCAEIWRSGFYKMYADFKTTTKRFDCMIIQASDVVVDCDNHTIQGMNKQGHGFWIRRYGFPVPQTPNNVEIRNCRVSNARDGVYAEAGTNLYIHDNDFSDNFDDVDGRRFGIFLGMVEGGGIRLDHTENARIENNKLTREAIGIDIRDSQTVTIRYNTATGNSAWGINLVNTSQSLISNNTLRDNIRYCVWGNGTVGRGCDAGGIILQDGSSHNVIRENTVAGENGNGIFIKAHGTRCGDHNRIENNRILDAVYNAIEFSFCQGNQVVGNEITGSYDAVWFGFSANTEVRDNVIRNMTNHGIISYNSHDSIVADNKIINAREGIYFYWDGWDPKRFYFLTPTPDNYASRDNTITGNALQDNAVAAVHLSNSIENRVVGNTFTNNGRNIWLEGRTNGTVTGNSP